MKLNQIRVSNFQSFGPESTILTLENLTFLIGPNGSGKTAALQALCRMFAFDPSLRRVSKSDFHVPHNEGESPDERTLWVEADFYFPELLEDDDSATVAPHFGHMRMDDGEAIPRVRFRLEATIDMDNGIESNLLYVLEVDDNGEPKSTSAVPRSERNHIHVHYLPARRDPSEHITFGANAILGRLLRATNWESERETVKLRTDQISSALSGNLSVNALSSSIQKTWASLHKGSYYTKPNITFVANEIESLLRHLSLSFAPGHEESIVDFSRLSDGQKSILYLSLVLSAQAVGRAVLNGDTSFDPDKLRPPVFTLVAIEEPENSLSPHYLGRIVSALNEMIGNGDAQALVATHAPSMLRRVEPKNIRYLRLNALRVSAVKTIQLPDEGDEAHKFVLQAVKSFPEVYFSRLVVLGEGDSEEMVLPRILEAKGVPIDENSITIAPLGGRHVNHFWRLLEGLEIPYITLLDLDVGRYCGGWGRIKYVNDQLIAHCPEKQLNDAYTYIPPWNDATYKVRDYPDYINELESRSVFFSFPMDLDFSMLMNYPNSFSLLDEEKVVPDLSAIKAVLGKSREEASEYSGSEQSIFNKYHSLFKLGSKPAAHINSMSRLTNDQILSDLPASLNRMAEKIIATLASIPE